MRREYVLVLLVTAAVTYLLVPLVRRVALATHAAHKPRARDMHTEPTPLLGGLAMYGGLIAGLLIASRLTNLQDPFQTAGSRTQTGLLLAGGLIVIIGFVDDRWGLSAISKLAGQVAVGGIVVWSGQSLPWLPEPGGHVFLLGADLGTTLTILVVVVTINAINFIDGLDGLAAGIVGVAALSFLAYSYTLDKDLSTPQLSLPAVSSALLAGMCIGFLPHNFYPARIFMGDSGAMLLGLLLAYGPISSTNTLDPELLVSYNLSAGHLVDRFPTLLPLIVPAAIFLIPYADLMMAVIRRTRRGVSPMSADREHLHHRLLGIGHSYRQSVLIMWLWAALFSGTLVSLSLGRVHSGILEIATVVAALTLLPVTMPRLRPWRWAAREEPPGSVAPVAPVATDAPVAVAGDSVGARHRAAPAAAFAPAPTFMPPPAFTPTAGSFTPPAGSFTPPPGSFTPPPGNGAPSAGSFTPPPGNGAPSAGNGAGWNRANGTPPPGFDPLASATNGRHSGPVPGHGPVLGRGPDPVPAPSPAPGPTLGERGLRPFPGDAGAASWPGAERPHAGRLPDEERFSDTDPFPASPQPGPTPR